MSKEVELRKQRAELDKQWDAMMAEAQKGNIRPLHASILMEQYNRIDEELINLGFKVTE